MRDVLPTLSLWQAEGRRFAIAVVTKTWGSSPRQVGSVMAIRDDGLVVGSVSGGCVEGAVVEAALSALETTSPQILEFESISDETAWQVGLTCGGAINVWIQPRRTQATWNAIFDADRDERSLWIRSDTASGEEELSPTHLEQKEGSFVQTLQPRDRLLIVGASHIAIPLVSFAKALRFEVVVVDPRASFARTERFPDPPAKLLNEWPEKALDEIPVTNSTYAVVLAHDPKIDDQAIARLLTTPVAYIGALGSRSTHAKRLDSLRTLGFSDDQLATIHGPVGLSIGAKTPEEIALSIIAEIVRVKRLGNAR